MLVLTTTTVPDQRIVKTLGAVYGLSVRSRSETGNMLGKLRSFAGGSMGGYEKLVRQAREDAVTGMIREAESLGANAVIGFRFDGSSMGAGDKESFIEVTAYGTAVIIEANP
ncbi:hypothetical protein BAE30_03750 [Acidithiobacillus caldus]|jgi:uncharacterized protein YbjQ (UPF0145 family)|uniref:UPF0145 protein BAE30_03750 n=1 Tax=Acidithiobacillus caldus TaxID=33059 RepID=A0A1E7YZL6_9PROT|nr:hypothetical protein BAE30_03750 [Acidithiobacillus caldus]